MRWSLPRPATRLRLSPRYLFDCGIRQPDGHVIGLSKVGDFFGGLPCFLVFIEVKPVAQTVIDDLSR
jgi:hypothetical protein